MKSRNGFSLVELLIVMSVGTAMLMVAMSILYLLKETQGNVRQRLASGRRVIRLADQFRDDVHGASTVKPVPNETPSSTETIWQFTIQPNTIVRYEIRDDEVRRIRSIEDRKIQENYRLPAGVRATLLPPPSESTITTLRFETVAPGVAGTRPVQIDAVLGFTNRHAPQSNRTPD
jgi:prepilin-type N-terminal cleavage/methylation domain-containing protein